MRFLLLCVVGSVMVVRAHDIISTKITWSREVSRIVYKRCVSCHRDGGAAFSLVHYDEARPWAKAIKDEVLARRMPPWNAVKGFGEFRNEAGLTQEQIEVIADWVEGGAPEGNPAYLPPLPRPKETEAGPPLAGSVKVASNLTLLQASEFAGIEPGALAPGAAVQVIAALPDGSVEPLLWVENFNPEYNQPYYFAKPLKLPAGSRIEVSPSNAAPITLFRSVGPSERAEAEKGKVTHP